MTSQRTCVVLGASFLIGCFTVLGADSEREEPTKVETGRAIAVPPSNGGVQTPIIGDNHARLTREALQSSFPTDIREMVYRWDSCDPRSEEERRKALFDFMYEGFDSAAWVPQSLFKRKELLAPFGNPNVIITRTIGLIGWPQNREVKTFGMAPDLAPGRPLGWTANCVTCHITEIDGVVYFGGGGKVLDETLLKRAVEGLTDVFWRSKLLEAADDPTAVETNRIMRMHHADASIRADGPDHARAIYRVRRIPHRDVSAEERLEVS